jgi:hypothetical protein
MFIKVAAARRRGGGGKREFAENLRAARGGYLGGEQRRPEVGAYHFFYGAP